MYFFDKSSFNVGPFELWPWASASKNILKQQLLGNFAFNLTSPGIYIRCHLFRIGFA